MADPAAILVLGLGASGVAVARYCLARPERFPSVIVADAGDSDRLQAAAKDLRSQGAEVSLGAEAVGGAFDLCVASPGIPPSSPLMVAARQVSERTISEIQFAFEESSCRWVAVTGTNGKTTTTALIAHLLAVGGARALAVGNIGTPAIEAVGNGRGGPDDILVAEVSSFQLALTTTFRPSVAVLLNVTPDHIDWHGSFERYAEDKTRVFANMREGDVAILNVDDPESAGYLGSLLSRSASVVPVSVERSLEKGAFVAAGELVLVGDEGPVALLEVGDLRLRGSHNLTNALCAAAAARAVGTGLAELRDGLRSFAPIEHRLEPVAVVGDAEWFNDSKATNPDAVSKALAAFPGQPIVLLLGGRNKGNDFRPLAREAAEYVRGVVLFGESRDALAEAFSATDVVSAKATNLGEAVRAAARMARPGDAVVLSPACASFDEFENYEQRGREFKRMVAELAEEESGS